MKSDLQSLEAFKEHFAQYMNYMGSMSADSGIVKVSYQFLSDGQENQVAEVVGLVGSLNNVEPLPAA